MLCFTVKILVVYLFIDRYDFIIFMSESELRMITIVTSYERLVTVTGIVNPNIFTLEVKPNMNDSLVLAI